MGAIGAINGIRQQVQSEVAAVALRAAARHGFALAGGNALAVHGIISRPTEDIDLFSASDGAVQAAAGLVAAALTEAGFSVAEVTDTSDLSEVIYATKRSPRLCSVSTSWMTPCSRGRTS
jgi:Nucleotidyl transferase AbiEii toxin, Type IV TA system